MSAKAANRRKWPWIAGAMLSGAAASAALAPLGLTSVNAFAYTTATVVGILPGVALKVYIGQAGRSALTGGPLKWAMLAAGVAATIAMALIVGRAVKKRLQL